MNKQLENTPDNYDFFTNEYVLTENMCAEAEVSRMDVLFAVWLILLIIMFTLMMPFFPSMIQDYFSAPSLGTVFTLSGGVGITFLPPFAIIILAAKVLPKKVGAKRFQEQLLLVPGEKRRLSFYNKYVAVTGDFTEELPYSKLRRTGQTKHLYILYFKNKRILFVPKDGFRKGTFSDFKSFIRQRRTWGSKIYGIIRYLPILYFLFLFYLLIWEMIQ